MYAIGGLGERKTRLDSVEIYTPATRLWRRGPTLPGIFIALEETPRGTVAEREGERKEASGDDTRTDIR